MKNVNLLLEKELKSAERLTKTLFTLYLESALKRPKEKNKGDVKSISAGVTNMHQKRWQKLS